MPFLGLCSHRVHNRTNGVFLIVQEIEAQVIDSQVLEMLVPRQVVVDEIVLEPLGEDRAAISPEECRRRQMDLHGLVVVVKHFLEELPKLSGVFPDRFLVFHIKEMEIALVKNVAQMVGLIDPKRDVPQSPVLLCWAHQVPGTDHRPVRGDGSQPTFFAKDLGHRQARTASRVLSWGPTWSCCNSLSGLSIVMDCSVPEAGTRCIPRHRNRDGCDSWAPGSVACCPVSSISA